MIRADQAPSAVRVVGGSQSDHRTCPVDFSSWLVPGQASLIQLREDPIYDDQGALLRTHAGNRDGSISGLTWGALLRTHAGVDYSGSGGIPLLQALLPWTAVWEVSEQTAQEVIQHRSILFGTTYGYIDRDHVALIIGARRTPSGNRIWWGTMKCRRRSSPLRAPGCGCR